MAGTGKLTCEFVTGVPTPAPMVRLDIARGAFSLRREIDFSPPALRRTLSTSPLADGGHVAASSYELRTVTVPLLVEADTPDDLAQVLASLHRELDRPTNVLAWSNGQSNPVYFRTFRSPAYALDIPMTGRRVEVDLEILAEPFAYGPRVDREPVTVTNDPAAGPNGMYLDVRGVEGDVETPAHLTCVPSESVFASLMIATRRRGDPTTNIYWSRQCETWTLYTDTSLLSGQVGTSGDQVPYTTFDTTYSPADYTPPRLSLDNPLGEPAEKLRGSYRVFAVVVAPNDVSGAPVFRLRATWSGPGGPSSGLGAVEGRHVDFAPRSPGRYWMDLGLFDVPTSHAPPAEGYGSSTLPPFPGTEGYGFRTYPVSSGRLWLKAARLSGYGWLGYDYVLFAPADDSLGFFEESAGNLGASDSFVLDGPNNTAYARRGGNLAAFPLLRTGGIPMLSPEPQTNRLIVGRPDRFGADINHGDVKTRTTTISVSYWPRHLLVR
ncbi:MAG: hypothetical protein M3404_02515 [Actinomycetota bacterium]|nr:hypothetical protein [Actinomycetota bacterium]